MVYVPHRVYTSKILDAIDEGILDRDQVILACLNWMSEQEVKNMAECNDFFSYEEESEEELDTCEDM